MTAWRLVLAASFAMPLLVQLLAPWATVTIPAAAPLAQIAFPNAAKIDRIVPQTSSPAPERGTKSLTEDALTSPPAEPGANQTQGIGKLIGWQAWIAVTYVLIGGTLLLRMLIGIALGFRLIRTARPLAEPWTAGSNVCISNAVSMPVTFGSTILLPADCINWGAAKRQAVLSHEKSHIDHSDFVILMLASLHRAVFWFNPLSWWLLRRLTELSEIISDDAAVAVLRDQHSYAAILLDIAGSARPMAAGVAMARPHTVRRRIERLLTATAPATPITLRRRLSLALALLPLVAIAAIGITRGAPTLAVTEARVVPPERPTLPVLRWRGRVEGLPSRGTEEIFLPGTCNDFASRLRNAGRELSLATLPNPRFQSYRPFDLANTVTHVTYDWPDDTPQIGELSCFNNELILYRMRVDTSTRRRQSGDTPHSSHDLQVISAAIFAYTGAPPTTGRVQLLLARQPRQPNGIDETLRLPSGQIVWLQYDSFSITWPEWQLPNVPAL